MLNRWQRTIVDLRGNVVPYAQLQVRVEATQAAALIYRDSAGTEAIPNGIVTANEQGYVYFYAPAGLYRITSAEPVIDWRDVNIGSAEALLRSNNLSDLSSASSARSNLGLGTSAELNIATTSQAQALTNDATVITPKKLLDSGAVFAGEVRVFAGPIANIPEGWLPCNGAAVSRTTYSRLFGAIGTTYGSGNGSTTFNIPDLRGEFIRGLDNGRGVDAGRVLGSAQGDEYRSHGHNFVNSFGNIVSGARFVNSDRTASGNAFMTAGNVTDGTYPFIVESGGNETRPRNVAMNYIIKY